MLPEPRGTRPGENALVGVAGSIACGLVALLAQASAPAAPGVSLSELRRHTLALGSDAFEGRAPGTPGGLRAAAYLADALAGSGIQPAARGEWFQDVPLHGVRTQPSSELILSSPCGERVLRPERDFLLFTAGQQTRVPRPTPVVFAGWGIVAPEYDHNDYLDLDVRDRVVLLLAGEPESDDPAYFEGERPTIYSSPAIKERVALSRGARGSLLIPEDPGDGWRDWDWWRQQFAFEHLTLAYALPEHLSALVRSEVAAAFFCQARTGLDEVRERQHRLTLSGFELPAQVRFRGSFEVRDFLAPNVVGVVRGSDPELARTAVLVSAHYDHLGVGPPVDGDAIYNGVLDNAIGAAAVLEIARAVAALPKPPRRSVVFLLTTGEEEGLLGASFYVDHPVFPVHRTVAALNVDGLSSFDRVRSFHALGGEITSLGDTLAAVAERRGLAVVEPTRGGIRHEVFARSDQKAFAEAGIPAVMVTEGLDTVTRDPREALVHAIRWTRQRYHTPFDDLAQPIDWEAARQHADLLLAFVLAVADADEVPSWKPGAPYRAAQLRALAEER